MLESSRAAETLPKDTLLASYSRRGGREVKEGGRQGEGRREKGNISVSPTMRPSTEYPGECFSGCLVVPGIQDAADRPPRTPRVTEKHIQEELVFLLTFLTIFSSILSR